MSGRVKPIPYRELSKPFSDRPSAAEATNSFVGDVVDSRFKHRIGDAVVVMMVSYETQDEENPELQAVTDINLGDPTRSLYLLAYGYQKERDRIMAKVRESDAMMAGADPNPDVDAEEGEANG